jgi:hypothetical protein
VERIIRWIRRIAKIGFIRKIIKTTIYLLSSALVAPSTSPAAQRLRPPPPPNTIPENLFSRFTLDHKIPVVYCYYDNTIGDGGGVVHNTPKTYEKAFKQIRNKTFKYYGKEINAFYETFAKYSFNDKTVLIWGLAGCNCEALAIYNGAKKVYVVDYNKPICDHPSIEVLTHEELKTRDIKTDFAISYSSFEHDGLGRYGDPIDPDGDFRAMQEAHKALNDDGVLFFGVPLGKDALCWNAHRIYGKIRLPLILKGWRCTDVFSIYDNLPFETNEIGEGRQAVMVLRKIDGDFPSDDDLNETLNRYGATATRNDRELSTISRFILEHKRSAAQFSDRAE